MADLKPCPFCGSPARLFTGNSTGIACSNDQCVIYTDMPLPFNDHGHLDSAVAAWNRRVTCGVLVDAPTQPTDEEILALAHRTATSYAHRSDPTYRSYAFVPHTLLDFARKLLAARGVNEVPHG